MAWLHKAVAAGYKDRALMEKDKDLDALWSAQTSANWSSRCRRHPTRLAWGKK